MSVEGSQFPSAKTKLSATTLSQRKNVSKLFPILNTPEAKLTKYIYRNQIFPAGINLNSLSRSDHPSQNPADMGVLRIRMKKNSQKFLDSSTTRKEYSQNLMQIETNIYKLTSEPL